MALPFVGIVIHQESMKQKREIGEDKVYGKTRDEFEYKGTKFRWVLSPNKYIYQVWCEGDLIGAIPVSQVRVRNSPEAIKALYPICDTWLEKQPLVVTGTITVDLATISGLDISGSAFTPESKRFTRVKTIKAKSNKGVRCEAITKE